MPLTRTSSHSTQASYDKILGYVAKAKANGDEVLIGGTGKFTLLSANLDLLLILCSSFVGDDKTGFFVHPTVIVTKDPKSLTMVEEIFGPVLTTYVYEDAEFEEVCKSIDTTTDYALTGCM